MSIGDCFFLFMLFVALQPAVRQRLLEAVREKLLREFERARGSRTIVLIHRQEAMGVLGFPLFRYLDIEDSEEILRAVRLTSDDTPIDLVLHTPGGLVLAAGQIARALAAHPAKVTVFVPHYAMSGGTLLALAADEVVMDPAAVLGTLDPQLGPRPAASILRVVEQKPAEHVDDQTLIEADIARMALTQVREEVLALVADKLDAEAAARLADELTTGRYTHDYPLSPARCRELGIPVSEDFPELLHDLMDHYPQLRSQRPSVHYLPGTRGRDDVPAPPPARVARRL